MISLSFILHQIPVHHDYTVFFLQRMFAINIYYIRHADQTESATVLATRCLCVSIKGNYECWNHICISSQGLQWVHKVLKRLMKVVLSC